MERPSKLGAFSYEVVDTKLKRSPDPKHLLQLGLYAHLLTEIQGVAPERIHIELGNNERASFRLFDRAERETEELIDDLDSLGGLQALDPFSIVSNTESMKVAGTSL